MKSPFTYVRNRLPTQTTYQFDRHQIGHIIPGLWSTLSVETVAQLTETTDRTNLTEAISTFNTGDKSFGRSPFDAADYGAHTGTAELRPLKTQLTGEAAEVLQPQSLQGSGSIAITAASPYARAAVDSITKLWVGNPCEQIRSRERVLTSLNMAGMETDGRSHLLLSKQNGDRTDTYLQELADLIVSLSLVDSGNIPTSAVSHETFEVSDFDNDRENVEEAMWEGAELLGGPVTDSNYGFRPADFVPPGTGLTDIDIWAEDKSIAYVIAPEAYEGEGLIDGMGSDPRIIVDVEFSPLSDLRVLVVRELSDEFLTYARQEYTRWLYENANEISAWRKEVAEEAPPGTDPQEAVRMLLKQKLGVTDPVITEVFEEVETDV